jgi:hypothetical protein
MEWWNTGMLGVIGEEVMLNLEQRIAEIRRRVSSTTPFLQARINAERSARQLLDARAGFFTTEELARFLDLCNTELVPPHVSDELRESETRTRFQLAFIGQNRCLMLRTIDECNKWIALLWKERTDELGVLDSFWRSSRIKGAGTGLPTMILYLKDPEVYSVWLGFLSEALSSIAKQTLPSSRTVHSYLQYNQAVDTCIRKRFVVQPQEIDYILYRLLAEGSLRGNA